MQVETFESSNRGTRVSIMIGQTEHIVSVPDAVNLAQKIIDVATKSVDEVPDNGRSVLVKLWVERYVDTESDRTEEYLTWRVGYYHNGWWDARLNQRVRPVAWCEIVMPPV